MKKPQILRRKNQQPRKIIRADKAPTDRLLAGGGRSLPSRTMTAVEAAEEAGMALKNQVPDASGAGLRRREQDAIDDRMARAGADPNLRRRALSPARSAALLTRQPICAHAQAPFRPTSSTDCAARLFAAAAARRLSCLAREPQCLQLRHVVEHGFGGWRRVRPCRICVLAPPLPPCRRALRRDRDLLFVISGQPSFRGLRPWPCFDRWFRRVFTVGGFLRQTHRAQLSSGFRIATSAAAISAIALMPSTSWARLRFSLISFSLGGASSARRSCIPLKLTAASSVERSCGRSYHVDRGAEGAIFGYGEKPHFLCQISHHGEGRLRRGLVWAARISSRCGASAPLTHVPATSFAAMRCGRWFGRGGRWPPPWALRRQHRIDHPPLVARLSGSPHAASIR